MRDGVLPAIRLNGHRNSGFTLFTHEKWWIFPVRYVKLPEGMFRGFQQIRFFWGKKSEQISAGQVPQLMF